MSLSAEEPKRATPWWANDDARKELLETAKQIWDDETSDINGIYAYSLNFLRNNFKKLKSLKNVSRIFYAMKANSNPRILQELNAMDAGFECVSLQELRLIKSLFPSIDASRILFTPNFACRNEYAKARGLFQDHANAIHLTVDNTWVLENWGEDFASCSIFLRVDPGEDGHGHHAHVHTGSSSKFGIEIKELCSKEFADVLNKHKITVVGLHMHKGSGITDAAQWARSASTLTSLCATFPTLRYVDVGGGLGIPYRPSDATLDVSAVDTMLETVVKAHPQLEFWLEPGRFVVAQCGVLLTRVAQLKSKGPHRFVGVSAGMNHLIRPALYDSYHHIVNLSRYDSMYLRMAASASADTATPASTSDVAKDFSIEAKSVPLSVNIVGPICETGDFLGHDRCLPCDTNEGDVVLVDCTGAYGRAMASEYNLRSPGPEIFVQDSS